MVAQLPAGTLSSGPPGLCLSPSAAPAPDAESPPSSSALPLCPGVRPQTAGALRPCTPAWCPGSREMAGIYTTIKMLWVCKN